MFICQLQSLEKADKCVFEKKFIFQESMIEVSIYEYVILDVKGK